MQFHAHPDGWRSVGLEPNTPAAQIDGATAPRVLPLVVLIGEPDFLRVGIAPVGTPIAVVDVGLRHFPPQQ